MNKFVCAVSGIALVFSVAACSGADAPEAEVAMGSGLAGTWKAQIESASFENATSSYLVADGKYTCNHCLPPYTVDATGDWVEVDRPGADAVKFTIVDDNTVNSAGRFEGRELGNSTWTVSDDGQTMTVNWTDMDGDETTTGTTLYSRAAAGPDGSHAVSGDWNISEIGKMSDAALTFTYAIDGDTVTSSSNGGGYTAVIGGEPVAIEGSESGSMIAVEKVSDNVYKEITTRDGEVINTIELTVDGDTLTGVSVDPRDGSTATWTAKRQS